MPRLETNKPKWTASTKATAVKTYPIRAARPGTGDGAEKKEAGIRVQVDFRKLSLEAGSV